MKMMYLVIAALVALGVLPVAEAQDAPQAATHEFHLEFAPDGFSIHIDLDLEGQEFAFKAEPTYQGAKIVRGALPTGLARQDATGFAWDTSSSTLHVDENRNLDLTDEPPRSTYAAEHSGSRNWFRGVTLLAGEGQQYRLDLFLSTYYSRATVRSGWKGDIELQGRTWSIGVADNLDGVIDGKDVLGILPVDHVVSEETTLPFPADGRVFFGNTLYKLTGTFREGGLDLTFAEEPAELAAVDVQGQHIAYLVMNGPPQVRLFNPSGLVNVPTGRYELAEVYVAEGAKKLISTAPNLSVNATGEAPTQLKVGTPLSNTLTIARTGRVVSLGFETRGAGGEIYDELLTDYANPPGFVAYQNGQEIASGSFDYG